MSRQRKKKKETMESSFEIKGLITKDEDNISLTCCDYRPRILIGGKDLYHFILEESAIGSPPSPEDDPHHTSMPSRSWKIRYCIKDAPFKDGESFEENALQIISSLESEYIGGCYSEWTCGVGSFDFVLKSKHSILTELENHLGKYVWVRFI